MSVSGQRSPRVLVVVALVTTALLLACVNTITGPTVVTLGTNVTYDIQLTWDPVLSNTRTNATVYLNIDIPTGWSVVAASYSGTVGGNPVSGTATVANGAGPGSCAPPPVGQLVNVSAGPFPTVSTNDTGHFVVTFHADGTEGPFHLVFDDVANGDEGPFCGNPFTYPITTVPLPIPALDPRMLFVMAALLCAVGIWRMK